MRITDVLAIAPPPSTVLLNASPRVPDIPILPCPFCGGDHLHIRDDYRNDYYTLQYGVVGCGVAMTADTLDDVVERWNRRG